jgi:Rps23 Pro-64 3,4-dihydroxylase Tpa1-like proline 4-hydroxylase
MNKVELANYIYTRIEENEQHIKEQYLASKNTIGYFYIDDLLPESLAISIFESFPKPTEMVHKKSIRENKYVGTQMDAYAPILEEIIFAFQEERIVSLIASICEIKTVFPDPNLYAGGLSMMGNKQFLNPHLDNSHDKDRNRWRVLNLLYYITPNWKEEYGGNLELWPDGLENKQVTIFSKFNRLAVMATHTDSLHSVSPVVFDGYRCCVSNYYFSNEPLLQSDSFHVTSFRGRPENKLTDRILQLDTWARMIVRKLFKKGIVKNPQVYEKKE